MPDTIINLPELIDNFTEAQAEELIKFLAAPERPEGTMSYPRLAGYLFAVSNTPEMIAPSAWLPMVFGDHEPGYKSKREMKEIMGALFSLYNFTSRGGDDGEAKLPPLCRSFDNPLSTLAMFVTGTAHFHGRNAMALLKDSLLHREQKIKLRFSVACPKDV